MSIKQFLVPCSSASICSDCQRACGGCSWSVVDPATDKIRFEPVPGWTAAPSTLYNVNGWGERSVKTYRVTACPLFLPDPIRGPSCGEATEDQLRIMMERWREEER